MKIKDRMKHCHFYATAELFSKDNECDLDIWGTAYSWEQTGINTITVDMTVCSDIYSENIQQPNMLTLYFDVVHIILTATPKAHISHTLSYNL